MKETEDSEQIERANRGENEYEGGIEIEGPTFFLFAARKGGVVERQAFGQGEGLLVTGFFILHIPGCAA